MLLNWNDSYKIGVEKIDQQHKELFDIVNKLFTAAQSGKSKEVIGEILNFLGKYVIDHFKMEEQLQQKHNYPKFTEHKAKHEDFIASFKELNTTFNSQGLNLSEMLKTNKVIADWVKNHVLKVDQELGNFLKDKV